MTTDPSRSKTLILGMIDEGMGPYIGIRIGRKLSCRQPRWKGGARELPSNPHPDGHSSLHPERPPSCPNGKWTFFEPI